MNTYKIELPAQGWFQVTVTSSEGVNRVTGGFVSEAAAEKWVIKRQKAEAKAASQPVKAP